MLFYFPLYKDIWYLSMTFSDWFVHCTSTVFSWQRSGAESVVKKFYKKVPQSLVALTFTLKQDFLARVGHTVRLSADSLTVLLVFAKKVNLTHWIWTADSAAFMWWFAINRAGSHHVLLCGWLEHFPCMGQILIKMQISVLFMRSEVPVQLYF